MKINTLQIAQIGLLCLFFVANTTAEETASLTMRFVYGGKPPKAKELNFPGFRGPILDETLLVNSQSRGIQNVVVWVDTERGGSELDLPPYKKQERRMTMSNTRFEPHVLIARAGDSLNFVDLGPNQHSANVNFFRNNSSGFYIPAGQPNPIQMPQPEPVPIPIDSNIHPWMRAYVLVLDHPFAAVSDSDGRLTIEGLPIGSDLKFRAFHEAGRINLVQLNDVDTEWRRGRFSLDLIAGANDLGEVIIPDTTLHAD